MRGDERYPLVSICIPTFNAESTIAQTLDSVLAQDYPFLDIVVSDNNSTDRTPQILESYAGRGVRFCTNTRAASCPSPTSRRFLGAYDNYNNLLQVVRGDYLAFYHSDDQYDATIVSRQVDFLQAHKEAAAVFTGAILVGGDGSPIRLRAKRLPGELRGKSSFGLPEFLNAILRHGNFLFTPSFMVRREILSLVGEFAEDTFGTSADLEMWLRIASHQAIGVIDEPLFRYRLSAGQGSHSYHRLRTQPSDFYKVVDHYLQIPRLRREVQGDALTAYELGRSADSVRCAMNLLVQGNLVEARKHLAAALHRPSVRVAPRRPHESVVLLAGAGLYVSLKLGFGPLAARVLHRIYEWRMRRQRRSR